MRWRLRICISVCLLVGALGTQGCATGGASSPLQRQALETTYLEGEYGTIFRAIRTAFQNEGYMIEQSEFESGFLQFSIEVRDKNPALAGALGILPGGGSFYVGSWGLGAVDLLLWPFSVAWDGPLAAVRAHRSRRTIKATVTMVDLGGQSEVRTGFSGRKVDAEYAIGLKRMYAEVQRQVMMREHRDEVMAGDPAEEEAEETTEVLAPLPGTEEEPDATIEIRKVAVSAGVGFTWGEGTLEFEGHRYPFSLTGLNLADVGISVGEASGDVFRMKELSQFGGKYVSAESGVAAGKGIGSLNLVNGEGVVIRLKTDQKGLRFAVARGGVAIALKETKPATANPPEAPDALSAELDSAAAKR